MTWTMLPDDHQDQTARLDLSRSARLLEIEALIFGNRVGNDGALDRRHLGKLTDSTTLETDVEELVAAGVWTPTSKGFQCDWTGQETAQTVRQRKGQAEERQRRYRAHNKGDHSLCTVGRCRYATRDTTGDEREENATLNGTPIPPHPTSSHPTPDVVRGVGGADAPAAADASPGAAGEVVARLGLSLHRQEADCCALPANHPIHLREAKWNPRPDCPPLTRLADVR